MSKPFRNTNVLKSSSTSASISNSSRMTDLITEGRHNNSHIHEIHDNVQPISQRRGLGARLARLVTRDENVEMEVDIVEEKNDVEVTTTDKIPFSFPNLSGTGDKKMNLLVVGWQVPEILQGIRKQATDDEKCRGVFSIYNESTLVSGRPFLEFHEQIPIHFILIIMRASDPTALSQAGHELDCIDPVFLARKRFAFCMARQTDFRGDQRLVNGSKIELNALKAFCNYYGTMVHNIYFDQSESVAFGTKLIYNKIKRLLSHPC